MGLVEAKDSQTDSFCRPEASLQGHLLVCAIPGVLVSSQVLAAHLISAASSRQPSSRLSPRALTDVSGF